MSAHILLANSPLVVTFYVGTPNKQMTMRIGPLKLHEIIGLILPFDIKITLTSPAGVHPLNVLHPLSIRNANHKIHVHRDPTVQ
jgi:hypothetical protein